MKKTFTLLVISILTITLWAQSPDKLSYQAVVRDADNNLLAEQSVGMKISILQGADDGTAVYTELQAPTTNANGLVSIEIGSGVTSDDFSAIDWTSGPYFIKTEIDPAGSTDYTITATSQLLSVPYAKYAEKAGNAFSGEYGDLSGTPSHVSDFTNDAGYLTEVTGTETAFDGWDKDEDPWALNGSKVYYNEGYVGIGTDNPSSPLTINSGTGHSYIRNQNDNTGTTTSDGLLLGIDNNDNAWVYNYEDGDVVLGNTAGRVTVKSTGDINLGATKVGSSGVVFSELREITGTTSATSYTTIALPTGYNEDNTRVLSLEINYLGDRWVGIGWDNGNVDHASLRYLINESNITIYHYTDATHLVNRAYRILIMKVE